ncbi:PepSY-associated TM helix domain-containing protein [Rhodococcus erythropolis]|uniref:PepSY-associated TM helix domain-containing protein n=2 Tax=Rhodococcus TaxID=1827 RepID=UPI003557EB83
MSIPEFDSGIAVAETMSPADAKDSPLPRGFRPLIMRLHFYAGILVAPFLLIATISGGLYAIAPTIEQFVYSDYLHVDSAGPALPVAEQIRAARKERPDLTVAAVRPATDPGETSWVLFTDPSLGESERLAVFVDPATAHPVGELVVYGSSGALPMRTWIGDLHRNLHLGEPGRMYSELAASWLWVIAIGGVYLWAARYRTMRARGTATARLWTLDRVSQDRNRTVSWHGVAGLWIAAGLVFLSATGLTWSTYAGQHVSDLRSSLSWTTPTIIKALGNTPASAPAGDHGGHEMTLAAERAVNIIAANVGHMDSVLALARENGITGKVEASIPSTTDTAFTVAQIRQPWVMANNSIAIDGTTGTVTDTLWFADWPLAAKLSAWGIQAHMGILFGLANQLALAVLAVALVSVIVRGYILWWRRRPTRNPLRPVGRPPARGAWRHIHPGAPVAVVSGAVVVGWFVPLLGLSLLAFLLVDGVLGTRQTPIFSRVVSSLRRLK